jgi:hypothetical protein
MHDTGDASLDPGPTTCRNCATPLAGEYCHACGQKRIEDDWHSIPRFLRQFSSELLALDFTTVRSVAALFRPGHLPAEFLAGRRRRYLGPLKLFFVCAAIFFFVGPAVAGFSLEDLLAREPDGMLSGAVQAEVARKQMDFALFAERFERIFQTVYTLGMAVSVIAAALVLRVLFRRAAPALVPHLVFALYYVSFFCLLALLLGGLEQVAPAMPPIAPLIVTYLVLVPYAYTALRRVYGEPPGRTICKMLVLLAAGLLADSLMSLGAMYVTFALI